MVEPLTEALNIFAALSYKFRTVTLTKQDMTILHSKQPAWGQNDAGYQAETCTICYFEVKLYLTIEACKSPHSKQKVQEFICRSSCRDLVLDHVKQCNCSNPFCTSSPKGNNFSATHLHIICSFTNARAYFKNNFSDTKNGKNTCLPLFRNCFGRWHSPWILQEPILCVMSRREVNLKKVA